MKRVVILGSTGSIGCSALDVVRMHPDKYSVAGLSAGSNAELLLNQADEFKVDLLGLSSAGTGKRVSFTGPDASLDIIRRAAPDFVVNGISGAAGFLPSLEAVRAGAVLALANKESLVIGGHFLTREAKKAGVPIIPVDSEHSAVFQCLKGENASTVRRIILTASGGPFRDRPAGTFKDITPEEALRHPTWAMGKRITIDSATMMNKGLEIIEACWLFDASLDRIEVAIHPQSIVHSMVEFQDKSIKAQLSVPDMRAAIAYALSCPERLDLALDPLDFTRGLTLEFFPPDTGKFPALALARAAMSRPEVLPCIMNAADETAIEAFLSGRIGFIMITDAVKKTMDILSGSTVDSPEEVMELDRKSRKITEAGL